jgi:hypothetical protein
MAVGSGVDVALGASVAVIFSVSVALGNCVAVDDGKTRVNVGCGLGGSIWQARNNNMGKNTAKINAITIKTRSRLFTFAPQDALMIAPLWQA